jgi:uncharacterized protein (TIGR03435 family)
MPEMDDITLLREYAETGSEAAFAALVSRHVNLVYSTALRSVGNPHAAEEITQAVFIILAKKARSLSRRTVLSGWLYQTTRLTAANFLRTEIRRQHREQEAYMQSLLNEPGPEAWPQIASLLDAAMGRLGEKDRNAIVLRYFENKNLREVGAALGASEDAAKMRANRALELRKFFTKRGVTLSAVAIAGAVSAHSIQAAPVALTKSITAVAIAKGAAAGGSTLTLIKGALKIMAWTKMKTAIVSGVVVLLAAGTTTVTVKEIQEHKTYPWQAGGQEGVFDPSLLDRQPPQVRILPSKFTNFAEGQSVYKIMGTGLPAQEVVAAAYGGSSARTILSTELPKGRYDYIASLPSGNAEALQQEVKRKFSVVGKVEIREAAGWLLKVKFPNAPGLKHGNRSNEYMLWKNSGSRLEFRNRPLVALADEAEALANIPVIDETGLTIFFDFDLDCKQTDLVNRNWDNVNQALDQLGLELVPSRELIKMLVVEKVKD